MPTFLVLKGSTVVNTVRGANPSALRAAILSAAASAAKAPGKASASFSGKGQALGGAGSDGLPPRTANSSFAAPRLDLSALLASPASFAQGRGYAASIVRFVGLYLTTLLSLDPTKAAQESPFAMKKAKTGRSL